jgi:phosphoribosylanthranilate isomerase
MRVKICGITNIDDALLCSDLGADALGFIFYNNSKRNISVNNASEIINKLPLFISKVGVFVEQSRAEIKSIANNIGLTAVQLHNENIILNPDDFPIRIIKALRIKPGFDFSPLLKADKFHYLLDSYSENMPGGTGETFDWNLIPEEIKYKIILAGGISVNNIRYVFENIKPEAVDLSSSVESEPGRKNKNKLEEFFNIVNRLRYKC